MYDLKLLVVDDEVDTLKALETGLQDQVKLLYSAGSYNDAVTMLKMHPVDVVVTDLRLKDGTGLDLLNYINENKITSSVIIITAYGSVESAVEAIRSGAYDYIVKPFRFADLKRLLKRLDENLSLRRENQRLKNMLQKGKEFNKLIGMNFRFRQTVEMMKQIAASRSTILISGETGTGKELAAEFIHTCSNRSDKPLVKINCGAIPETLLEAELFGYEKGAFTGAIKQYKGKIEAAEGGSLFLDEVGELTQPMQVKLLRVLQSNEFERLGSTNTLKADVRFMAATNVDLDLKVEKGIFREDLYYRLNVIRVHLPSLRERLDDIPFLVQHFIEKYNTLNQKNIQGIKPEVLKMMKKYPWKGNIRELENMIERAVVLSQEDMLDVYHFPVLEASLSDFQKNLTLEYDLTLAEVEKLYIQRSLQYHNDDKQKVAKALQIGLATLYRKIKEYEL
ncbi:MAG: sigma-54-dependent Fis family transcriptional regulator [Calditrichaeota bacterium]|nr:sigma-54-dependent Fis family transcriptional regulator [Calditrichota bacterium]RQV92329.1 MAG: sigma-54-dependent Fis family transcriptional regulator [bacterium]RQV98272.1 MAG: sigma-54-dependent Fis family transcriptional regulator [Calditrichota bacterium]